LEDRVLLIKVPFEYPVLFTRGALDEGNALLCDALSRKEDKRHRALFVVDDGVAHAWPNIAGTIERYAAAHSDRLVLAGEPMLVPGGERAKNDRAILESTLARIDHERLDRHAFVVAIGGGAMLDMVGYAAAVAHRGLRTVRLPSTVLAQGDSGVGVKCGVNAFGKKNFLGAFAPPFAVICDARFLETLALRDARSGMSEAVKVALVKDRAMFEWISAETRGLSLGEPELMSEIVRRSAEKHLDHIATSGDPFEQGSARPLDFGHWAAHKLESMTHHALRHGEAVAIGLALDAIISQKMGLCGPEVPERTIDVLRALGLSVWHGALGRTDRVLEGLEEFREHLGGELTVTMLTGIGSGREVHEVDHADVRAAIERLRDFWSAPQAEETGT
jgi:3-dehydroquinate synthase